MKKSSRYSPGYTANPKKRQLKYSIIALVIIGFVVWTFAVSPMGREDRYVDCDCERCVECVDYGDSECIIVTGVGSPPNNGPDSPAFRRKLAMRMARTNLGRQLLWCIQVMRLPNGVCISNFIGDQPDQEAKLGEFIKEKLALVKNVLTNEKNDMITFEESDDGYVEITLKVRRKEVLKALGFYEMNPESS